MTKILIACEESQIVCSAFRALGFEAYSCDIEPCSGNHPEWHLQKDVIPLLEEDWDLIIAHPPCTYLAVCGNKWMGDKFKSRFPLREKQRKDAIEFFLKFANAKCPRIAIENPVGIMSRHWRKPDQYIEPYWFGDPERKKTGLWLKNLPKLTKTKVVDPNVYVYGSGLTDGLWHMKTLRLPAIIRTRERSKTFPGFAKAMAEQWSKELI